MASTSYSKLAQFRPPFQLASIRTETRRDAAACLLLFGLAMAVPWQMSIFGYLPNSIDFILQYYPNLAFLAGSLRAGEIPLWNPYVFAGTPYLADPQSAVLYLPNWIFLLLLDTAAAARAILVFHYALAAIFTYLYLRSVRFSAVPALVGAAIFGISEYTITMASGMPLLVNMAWIPVTLFFLELGLQRHSIGFTLAAAIALTLQLLNGWLHGVYITGFALAATFLWHAITGVIEERSWRPLAWVVGLGALMSVVWAALGATLLLPTVEYMGLSNYLMNRGLEKAGGEGNVTILAIFGIGGTEGHGAPLGAAALLLMLIGAIYGPDRKRNALFVGLGGFSLLAAFGTKAPLYGYLYQWVPSFQTFHTPGRFMVLYLLCGAALTAAGIEALLRGLTRHQAVVVAALAILAIAPFYHIMNRMYGPEALGQFWENLYTQSDAPFFRAERSTQLLWSGVATIAFLALLIVRTPEARYAGTIAVLLVTADLLSLRATMPAYFTKPSAVFQSTTPLSQLKDETDHPFRILGYARNDTIHFLSGFPRNVIPTLSPPNLSMMYKLEDVQGYNPLLLRRYAQYIAAINGGPDDYHWALVYNLQSRLLDLLNVGYVMLRGDDSRLKNVTIVTGMQLNSAESLYSTRPKPTLASGLQVHSYLGNSQLMKDGQPAARLKVTDVQGMSWSFELRAGMETAEWAHDRPDLVSTISHKKPAVSATWDIPYPVHTYSADLIFPQPIDIAEITLERVEPGIVIVVPELAAIPVNPLQRYQQVKTLDGTRIYRNNMALPRTLLVPRAQVVPDAGAALERIQAADFDPRSEVVLEGPGYPIQQGSGDNPGQAVILSRSNNSERIEVRSDSYGFLLVNELSYPGWNAYLDGHRTRVWRANYLFRAIEVSPGDHEVEFRFEPDSLKVGLALSLPTLAILMAVAVFHIKTRPKKENTPQ